MVAIAKVYKYRETYARFDGRPVRSYIPLFVERHAKAHLAGLTS